MELEESYPLFGIAVDGFCRGNPGPGGYRAIDLASGNLIFQCNDLKMCTNNIAEFIGLVHAIMHKKKLFLPHYIFTDSETAISWVEKRKVNTTFTGMDEVTKAKLGRADRWLGEQKQIYHIVKWRTDLWGEIPADAGNKK